MYIKLYRYKVYNVVARDERLTRTWSAERKIQRNKKKKSVRGSLLYNLRHFRQRKKIPIYGVRRKIKNLI